MADEAKSFTPSDWLKDFQCVPYTRTTPMTPMPQAGDVIFVYSGGRDAVASCILQRSVFGPLIGPWFSHVAIALSGQIAMEASTEPDEGEKNWSGVPLDKGVRLRLIPDLFLMPDGHPVDKNNRAVLRHPTASEAAKEFGVHTPGIALMFGAGYSTRALIDAAQKRSAVAALIPESFFDWNAAPDEFVQDLLKNPHLCADLEKYLPPGQPLSLKESYFCSKLVDEALCRGGLLNKNEESPRISTPCNLFDELTEAHWNDVMDSDYGTMWVEYWQQSKKAEWEWEYEKSCRWAAAFRDSALTTPTAKAIRKKLDDFSTRLDSITFLLEAMRKIRAALQI